MSRDYDEISRRRFEKARGKVEPIQTPPPPKVPSDWAENYEPTEQDLALQREYEEKRARELAWQNTPADEPF